MRILVVGGTGLIGRHVVENLLKSGNQVLVLARHPPGQDALPLGATFIQGDLEGELRPALAGVEGLIHAAGVDPRVTPHGSAWAFFKRHNIDASARLFRQAREAGVRRAVFVTTYYHAVQPELAEVHPYVRSRLLSEAAALEACGSELLLSIVQPPNIIGRIKGRFSIPGMLADYVRSPAPLLVPPGGTNFMAASSLAEAIAAALERAPHGARYLLGDENLSWAALIRRFAEAAGRPRPVRLLPAALLKANSALLAGLNRILGKESGFTLLPAARLFTSDFYYDSSDAQRALRYTTGNLDEAIRAALA